VKVSRPSSYPTNDGLNFEGIDFPTPVSQIDRLERQNPNLAINVIGWDKEQVIVHRISEKEGNIPRINLMITKQGDNTQYSYVKRLTALLYDQNRHNDSKHFRERCLHGYSRKELLERHKPECKGLLKTATRTEMLKEGENKTAFKNHYKQMKAPYVVYADFECVLEKIAGCEPPSDKSFTVKTEKHEPCGFSYIAVRSDGKLFGPFNHRGRDAVYVFLTLLQNHEREMREDMANKRPLVMTPEDWQEYRNAFECHTCNKSLFRDQYCDSMAVYDYNSGKYCGQSHRRCYHQAAKNKKETTKRRNRRLDRKNARDMPVLRRSAACNKLQRLSERPRPHDRKILRRCTQRMQLQAKTERENDANPCCLSQSERLRWAPANASDGKGAGRNQVHTNKHRKVHVILAGQPEIHRQREFHAEQPGQAGKGKRRVPNHGENAHGRKHAEAAAEERHLPVRVHGLVREV